MHFSSKVIWINGIFLLYTFTTLPTLADPSQSCAMCHPKEYKEWQSSHHDLAMQLATEKNVLGDFNNSSFVYYGKTTHFFKKNKRFYIRTTDADGKNKDFEVKYTFGVNPLQQYLIEFPKGRLQAFTIAWDTRQKKWFALQNTENIGWKHPLHWSKRFYNWNHFCADCHSTQLSKNYDATSDTYRTHWADLNVGCQACHGPGEKHIRWAQHFEKTKTPNTSVSNKFIINYKNTDKNQLVESCAQCHSRRHAITTKTQMGAPLLDNYLPEILNKDIYYADGGIQEEVYEYGSFLQSKMFQAGVTCIDCHNAHSLKLKSQGNSLCVQCHNVKPATERFPTLIQKNYDTPKHHFHQQGSPGSQCINCHMPPKTYMKIDVRRDHYFRIPRPDLTVKFGIPNACNTCHTNKSASWAVDALEKKIGKKSYEDYTEAFVAGRKGEPAAENKLIVLANDKTKNPMARATAISLLRQYNIKNHLHTIQLALQDSHPMVRYYAVRNLEILPPEPRLLILTALLNDPIRAVRLETARVLANVPIQLFKPTEQVLFKKALSEYQDSQQAQIDQPEGNFNLGMLAQRQGQIEMSENYYQAALKMDSSFYPASENLAMLYNQTNRNTQAKTVLESAIRNSKDQGSLYYALGLLFAEQNDFVNSAENLSQAVKLLPNNLRVYYNYSLALQKLDKMEQAEAVLLNAHKLNFKEPQILEAIVTLYSQQQQWEKAYNYATKLLNLYPNSPQAKQLIRIIDLHRTKEH